jgi:hypothetical protein
MGDEETPSGPPRFPPVDEGDRPTAYPPPGFPPAGYGPPGYPPGYPPGRRHWLHPLDVGRTFGAAFRLYRLHWKAMLGAMAILFLPALVLFSLVEAFIVGPAMVAWQNEYTAALLRGDLNELPLPPAVVLLSFVGGLVIGAVSMLSSGAVIHVADAAYRGGSATAGQAVRAALDRAGTLIGVFFVLFAGVLAAAFIGVLATVVLALLGLLVGGASLAVFASLIGAVGTIVAIVFLGLRWCLAVQAVMCDGAGAVASVGRSWRLVSGSTWRLLGYNMLFIAILLLIGVVVGVIVLLVFRPNIDFTPGSLTSPVTMSPVSLLAQSLLGGLASLLFTPWWLIVLTVFYYDLRWRRGEEIPDQSVASGASVAT